MSAPYVLCYKIPEDSGMENPSYILRRIGFRIDGSVWVLHESDMPYALLNRFNIHGVAWHTLKFDMTENQKLVTLATEALKTEIKDAVNSGYGIVYRANVRLVSGNDTPTDAIKKHKAKCIATSKRLGLLFKDLKHCADRFGIPESELNLSDARAQVRGLRSSMQKRVEEWVSSIAKLEEYAGSADPIVKAAKAGTVPHWILADYMEDRGIESKKLRTMFD